MGAGAAVPCGAAVPPGAVGPDLPHPLAARANPTASAENAMRMLTGRFVEGVRANRKDAGCDTSSATVEA